MRPTARAIACAPRRRQAARSRRSAAWRRRRPPNVGGVRRTPTSPPTAPRRRRRTRRRRCRQRRRRLAAPAPEESAAAAAALAVAGAGRAARIHAAVGAERQAERQAEDGRQQQEAACLSAVLPDNAGAVEQGSSELKIRRCVVSDRPRRTGSVTAASRCVGDRWRTRGSASTSASPTLPGKQGPTTTTARAASDDRGVHRGDSSIEASAMDEAHCPLGRPVRARALGRRRAADAVARVDGARGVRRRRRGVAAPRSD